MPKRNQNLIAIHRGRNKDVLRNFRALTDTDYNFDFRGIAGGSRINVFWLVLKAFITSKEIPEAANYLVEGGMLFWVGYFLKRRYRSSKLLLYVPEPAFFVMGNRSYLGRKFFDFKIKSMRDTVDFFLPITPMVESDAKKSIGESYRGEVVPHNIDQNISVMSDEPEDNLLFVIDRPLDTGFIKGLDIALTIHAQAKNLFPSTKLIIVGAGTEILTDTSTGVVGLGFREISSVFPLAKILIAPSRYDALNRAASEAAMAGLWILISEHVGLKDYLPDQFKDLVLSTNNLEEWCGKISELMSRPAQKRLEFANLMTAELRKFDQFSTDSNFNKTVSRLCNPAS